MAKLNFVVALLLVGQAMCSLPMRRVGLPDDDSQTDEEFDDGFSTYQKKCVNNPSFDCSFKSCYPIDKAERDDMVKNCPKKCITCEKNVTDGCKDKHGYSKWCEKLSEACDDSIPVEEKSGIIRVYASIQTFRDKLWEKCRKTCNYGCPQKMAAPENMCPNFYITGRCCWFDNTIDYFDNRCPPCMNRAPGRVCQMFRSQCTCKTGSRCENSGEVFRKYCPMTCGVCFPDPDPFLDSLGAFE